MTNIPIVVTSKSIYKNEYLEIKVDALGQNENVWEHAYFVKPNANGAGVLAADETGIYLVNQYRHPSREYFWQIPMGMIDEGMGELETAKKELGEETGITAETYTPIGHFVAEPGMSNQKTFVYVAEGLTFGDTHFDPSEVGMKLKHFTFEEIQEGIRKGAITCGFTLSALLLYKNNYPTGKLLI